MKNCFVLLFPPVNQYTALEWFSHPGIFCEVMQFPYFQAPGTPCVGIITPEHEEIVLCSQIAGEKNLF